VTAIERKFFHSFPRPRPSDTPETLNARALAILRLVKEIGLIVAPEIQGGTHRSIKYDQLRICFTEFHESELRQHAQRFGPFALEFEIGRLRQMGALPVIYMPQPVSAGDPTRPCDKSGSLAPNRDLSAPRFSPRRRGLSHKPLKSLN
jgi:hypothetical protein